MTTGPRGRLCTLVGNNNSYRLALMSYRVVVTGSDQAQHLLCRHTFQSPPHQVEPQPHHTTPGLGKPVEVLHARIILHCTKVASYPTDSECGVIRLLYKHWSCVYSPCSSLWSVWIILLSLPCFVCVFSPTHVNLSFNFIRHTACSKDVYTVD